MHEYQYDSRQVIFPSTRNDEKEQHWLIGINMIMMFVLAQKHDVLV